MEERTTVKDKSEANLAMHPFQYKTFLQKNEKHIKYVARANLLNIPQLVNLKNKTTHSKHLEKDEKFLSLIIIRNLTLLGRLTTKKIKRHLSFLSESIFFSCHLKIFSNTFVATSIINSVILFGQSTTKDLFANKSFQHFQIIIFSYHSQTILFWIWTCSTHFALNFSSHKTAYRF